ncbi:MAG: hypothetical protein CO119_01035 [Flavobacteriales bacterium CG_4_9_14_3_um_filter_40_17]|nr:MAG: hypothetical protein CO119_01035 [Flavobacteriales bacterium CG_4_9_14_3_um_filter_40_17]
MKPLDLTADSRCNLLSLRVFDFCANKNKSIEKWHRFDAFAILKKASTAFGLTAAAMKLVRFAYKSPLVLLNS